MKAAKKAKPVKKIAAKEQVSHKTKKKSASVWDRRLGKKCPSVRTKGLCTQVKGPLRPERLSGFAEMPAALLAHRSRAPDYC
eukprot:gene9765-biopygen1008